MCLAIPGRLLAVIDGDDLLIRRGRVAFGGIEREVDLSFVPEARIGDHLLTHVGVAIAVVDEQQAERTLAAIRSLGEDPSAAEGDDALPR